MKVVIVAKTRMGRAACIGAVTFSGQSVRLVAHDREENETAGMEYEVGDVWDVHASPDPALIPPHIENIIVHEKKRLPPLDDPTAFIFNQMPPKIGGLEQLCEGLTQATQFGSLYVTNGTGVPSASTMFWQPDQPLHRDDKGKRIRYCYPSPDGARTLVFVGFQDPVDEIPAGTLLRVSLAHWWRPEEKPHKELRCYVQLSGWFLPQQTLWPTSFPELGDEPYFDPLPLPATGPGIIKRRPKPSKEVTLEDAYLVLSDVFGFDEFRPLQSEIIERVLAGQDTVAIMPTGSGKSLCYQLPALLMPGLTVVVSPLIALMQDQVDALREMAVPAAFLNSTLSFGEYMDTKQRILAGEIQLLYVAPETLLRPETLALLEACPVDCLTIDEAHCISEWGHDFRPEYRQLVAVRRRNPEATCLALTATATPRVQDDISQSLAMPEAGRFVASFDRPNLFLSAQSRRDETAQLLAFLEARRDQAGIIYCPTRRLVDETAAFLQGRGWDALPYHAGLEDHVRRTNQRRFIHGDDVIIVATIAFGMGIDKPNVRFVLHLGLPKDIESYYQQIGRAGRDGLPADCLLLFSYSDIRTINYFIGQQAPDQQAGARFRLNQLISFAETGNCRRLPLLNYFGEQTVSDRCENCDNCLAEKQEAFEGQEGEAELADMTVAAQKFLSCVKRTGERFGAAHVINVLCGSRAKTVLKWRHDRLSTYGVGVELSRREWSDLADQFLRLALIERDPEHGSLSLTPKAYEVFKGEPVLLRPPRGKVFHGKPADDTEYDRELFELLREKRHKLADAADVPPYIIFGDRSLIEMATYFPQTPDELATIYGVGKHKLETYGEAFVAAILEYCFPRGINSQPKRTSRPPRSSNHRDGLSPRTVEYAELYNGGMAVDVIAGQYGVKRQTVTSHLWQYVRAGNEIRTDGLRELLSLSPEEHAAASAAFAEWGDYSLGSVYRELEEQVSYDDLSIVRLLRATSAGRGEVSGEESLEERVVRLGKSGKQESVLELANALQHENGNVRRLAASALGKLQATEGVLPLLALLDREEKPQVRQYAVKALEKIGDQRALKTLASIAADQSEMAYTRKAAQTALDRLK